MEPEFQIPEGLVSRIMRRLGLEQQLRIVRRHAGFFAGLTLVFGVLFIFAIIGFREVMTESSFGPYVSLIFSDPGAVARYWHSFVLSLEESLPGLSLALLLFVSAVVLLMIRLVARAGEKIMHINHTIHHGNR